MFWICLLVWADAATRQARTRVPAPTRWR